jgi:hypothetical protein
MVENGADRLAMCLAANDVSRSEESLASVDEAGDPTLRVQSAQDAIMAKKAAYIRMLSLFTEPEPLCFDKGVILDSLGTV